MNNENVVFLLFGYVREWLWLETPEQFFKTLRTTRKLPRWLLVDFTFDNGNVIDIMCILQSIHHHKHVAQKLNYN